MLPLLAVLVRSVPELRTAPGHPMRYYVSRPRDWAPGRRWPVLVAVGSATRDFPGELAAFAAARDRLGAPFIVVAPQVLTAGGARVREVPTYTYDAAAWARAEAEGPFRFDEAGLAAVVADVARRDGGEDRPFLTGWEAGGHTVWALAFRFPARFRAVAPVTTNWQGRWMEGGFSADPARTALPLRVFMASEGVYPAFAAQTEAAVALARRHGYTVDRVTVQAPHGPLAEAVTAWFASLLTPPAAPLAAPPAGPGGS